MASKVVVDVGDIFLAFLVSPPSVQWLGRSMESQYSIPDAPSPVFRHDSFPTFLNLLRGVPQIEIDQYATYGHVHPTLSSHGHGTSQLLVLVSKSEDLISDSFDCDDARSPDTHFLLGPVLEVVS